MGSLVLDVGCGAGLDTLIAAQRTVPEGRVIAIDFSEAMLARARLAAVEAGMENIQFYKADAEEIPVEGGIVDVALINGIFNLNPNREAVFREIARVVRSGGIVYAAELILKKPLSEEVKASEHSAQQGD